MDKKTLLVADDEKMNRVVIQKLLGKDYNVIAVDDGAKALDVLGKEKVDVLLLDIIMPVIDGLQVLERVRSNPKYNRLGILVATSAMEKTERTVLSLGADDVVSKPYDPVVIKKRVENILATKELELQKDILQDKNVQAIHDEIKKMYNEHIAEIANSIDELWVLMGENIDDGKMLQEAMEKLKYQVALLRAVSEN